MSCGNVSDDVIATARAAACQALGVPAIVAHRRIDPEFALDTARGQYNSTLLLKRVVELRPPQAWRVLGISAGDLFIPMLSFVFGQAQLGGPGAIVSTARLRQEFYGLPPDSELTAERLRKEVLHELGHTASLVHCSDSSCAMSLATGIRHVDLKLPEFCPSCRVLVSAAQKENRN